MRAQEVVSCKLSNTNNTNNIILMAVYNGESYLSEQIESIVDQTYENWTLLIRDDGSTDDTLPIIKKYSDSDERVELLVDDKGFSGSSKNNFNVLCAEALQRNYDYYFFSDQDDVWVNNKIEVFLDELIKVDQDSLDKPLLLYSDLSVVDENKKMINQSFMNFQGLKNKDKESLKTLLVQNYVTGCAMAINKSLLTLSHPFPKNIIMHDWWLAICAAATGKIVYINQPLIYYRQHSLNIVGAKGFWSIVNPFDNGFISHWSEGKERFKATIIQAGELYTRLLSIKHNDSVSRALKVSKNYSLLLSSGRFRRLIIVMRLGAGRQGVISYLFFLGRLFLMPRENKQL